MKIGIVCYPTFGGSGVVATELGLGLADKGHNVHFITYKRPVRLTTFHANVYFHEVTSMEYPLFEFAPYETSLASKLVDVVRFEKIGYTPCTLRDTTCSGSIYDQTNPEIQGYSHSHRDDASWYGYYIGRSR